MSRHSPTAAFLPRTVLLLLLCSLPPSAQAQQTPISQDTHFIRPDSKNYIGNEACASCHAEIFKKYQQTAMAQASGPAMQGLLTGEFFQSTSGVHYRVYIEDGRAWMSYERSGENEIYDKKELLNFIGSGRRGRTYLFSVDDFVFEAPINWYGQQQLWDMAPAYQKAREIPMNLPAVPACLTCHTSNSQTPVPGTENRYALPLFAFPGVSCERCHGPGKAHAQTKLAILNPAKLAPDRRDAICMQCHFEGKVAIQQPGHSLADFQAGDILSDYVHYYVLASNGDDRLGALSQFEALAQSVCKQKSGDKMACISCHDPHFTPSKEEKVAYYRSKCLRCHGEKLAAKHKSKEPDCRVCHMPTVSTSDIAHTQVTDHRIVRDPKGPSLQSVPVAQIAPHLARFPTDSSKPDTRDFALAWATLAQGGMKDAEREANRWLNKAILESPNDSALLSALGYEEQKRGLIQKAREHYLHALESDPLSNEAAMNLGVIEAQAGNLTRALALLQGPFERIPGRSEVGMNLALLYCATGQMEKAQAAVTQVLEFNPDLTSARNLQRKWIVNPSACGIR